MVYVVDLECGTVKKRVDEMSKLHCSKADIAREKTTFVDRFHLGEGGFPLLCSFHGG